MNTLVTKKSFKQRCTKLVKQHSALMSDTQMDLSPGWLELFTSTLTKFKKVLGADNANHTNILLIGEENSRLNIIAEYPKEISVVRREAANVIISNAMDSSRFICKKCGLKSSRNERGRMTDCEAHPAFEGDFKEDFEVFVTKNLTNVQALESAEATAKVLDIRAANTDSTPEKLLPNPPVLKIFNAEHVHDIKKSVTKTTADGDAQKRITNICNGMLTSGETLPYGVLPSANSSEFDELLVKFPNFEETINVIKDAVELARIGDGKLKLPNILLLGPPGIGKTLLANQVAKILNVDFLEIRMENEQNSATLSGSSEFWSNTQTGGIFNILTTGKTANPLVLVDEVDKASGDSHYDPLAGLYSLLEDETAKRFEDQSMRKLPLDASGINWLLTANSIDNVPAPIRSRMIIHKISSPNSEQSVKIAKRIYQALREANAWGKSFSEELCDAAAEKLASHEPRKMKALLITAFGKAVREKKGALSENEIPTIELTTKNSIGFI